MTHKILIEPELLKSLKSTNFFTYDRLKGCFFGQLLKSTIQKYWNIYLKHLLSINHTHVLKESYHTNL
ncbi:hypothetical protein BpHYR1_033105 [Brachionus plicatilis]|uniref:Uncharacterized protein n=1 Tax=Brachionus plicatilis TaxID=10195 RepID=A0A3M7SZL0_BRAPC|nr:hypothetical protein BpHYR1_033105 [Brachionus plicatilis]